MEAVYNTWPNEWLECLKPQNQLFMKTFKTALFALAGAFALTSCTSVTFEEAVPPGAPQIENIPQKFQGKWVDKESGDSFTIEIDGVYGEELIDEASLVAFKSEGDWLYVNFDEDDYWHVGLGHLASKDKLNVYWFDPEDENLVPQLRKITKVQEFYDEEGEVNRYHLKPTKAEWERIQRKKLFTLSSTFYRE